MPGIYRPRHPERTVLYRVLFHNFDRFLTVYESRFEKEYGHFRPAVREVVERYLDCGNPRYGFARIRCPDCQAEHLLTFSCRTRGFCPLLPRQAPGRVGSMDAGNPVVQTFGDRINFHLHLHLLVTEGGVDRVGIFHRIAHPDDSRLAEIFAGEILALLVSKELLSPEWAERLLGWRARRAGSMNSRRSKAERKKEFPINSDGGKLWPSCRWLIWHAADAAHFAFSDCRCSRRKAMESRICLKRGSPRTPARRGSR